jgi:hypothetical protein
VALAEDRRVDAMARLRAEWPLWASACAKIVNTAGQLVPLMPKPAQTHIWEAIQAQRDEGKPVRLIVPKARKEGVSTMAVSLAIQRTTLTANHNALVVAQDAKTSAELLQMAVVMHANLPDSEALPVKPPIANRVRHKELVFGNPARKVNVNGDFGINSRIAVDTASELEAGRGFTLHTLHCSEPAFWPDLKRKLTSLLNAVPDEPETMIVLESTSNGYNHWRDLCLAAQAGRNDFALVFLPWFMEPQYARAFVGDEERGEFIEGIGLGDWGEAEHELIDLGCSAEQLAWRRWAIENRCQGDLRVWMQEYPSTLEESFLASGLQVFNPMLVARARRGIERDELVPVLGSLKPSKERERRLRYSSITIPEGPVFHEGRAQYQWTVWERPDLDPDAEPESYVIGVDPAGDEPEHLELAAMHGAVVLEHRTGRQVAELHCQGDADEVALQLYLAALWFHRAWVAIETTGGFGMSMARRLFKDYAYPFTYRRKTLSSGKDQQEDRLGWDTNRATKVVLEDGGKELLREGTHGLRSLTICSELNTYIKAAKNGRHGPAPGQRSDLLMAWLIAAQVRTDVAPSVRRGPGTFSTSTRGMRSRQTGW